MREKEVSSLAIRLKHAVRFILYAVVCSVIFGLVGLFAIFASPKIIDDLLSKK